MTSDESKVTRSSQTHQGLDIELSLLPFPELGLLPRVGLLWLCWLWQPFLTRWPCSFTALP